MVAFELKRLMHKVAALLAEGPEDELLQARLHARAFEEIGEQSVAVLRGDALGMELHAVNWQRLVLQAHDEAIGGLAAVTSRHRLQRLPLPRPVSSSASAPRTARAGP